MPNHDYECEAGHQFERRCSIADYEASPTIPCTVEGCTGTAKLVFLTMAHFNPATAFVNDYPGSKRLKAGYVHHACDPGVKKVSVGAGGVLNPKSRERSPEAKLLAQGQWDRASDVD